MHYVVSSGRCIIQKISQMGPQLPFLYRYLTSFNCFESRIYMSTIAIRKKTEQNLPTYIKRDHEFKISKKALVKTLEELLRIRAIEAHDIVLSSGKFNQVPPFFIKSNYLIYKKMQIKRDILVKHPDLLVVDNIELKVNYLRKLSGNLNDFILLVNLPIETLQKYFCGSLYLKKSEEKIEMLCELLEINKFEVSSLIAQKPFLLSLNFDKIKRNIEILLHYGITTQDIWQDLWVLQYSAGLIKLRFDLAITHNIEHLKTWMVRAPNETFQTYIQRRSDNKSILGESSLAEYLAERLECNVATANYMIMKQPALKNKSLKKLKELIDFLYGAGFKSSQICRVPKILVHSTETISKRLKKLEENGLQIDGLSVLTKSQNQFMQYFEMLLKIKNKTKVNE